MDGRLKSVRLALKKIGPHDPRHVHADNGDPSGTITRVLRAIVAVEVGPAAEPRRGHLVGLSNRSSGKVRTPSCLHCINRSSFSRSPGVARRSFHEARRQAGGMLAYRHLTVRYAKKLNK